MQAAGKGAQLGNGGVIGRPVVPPKPKPVPLHGARQYAFGPHVAPQPRPLAAPAAPPALEPAASPVLEPAEPPAPAPAAPPTWEVPASPLLALPAWARSPAPLEPPAADPASLACVPPELWPALGAPGSGVASVPPQRGSAQRSVASNAPRRSFDMSSKLSNERACRNGGKTRYQAGFACATLCRRSHSALITRTLDAPRSHRHGTSLAGLGAGFFRRPVGIS